MIAHEAPAGAVEPEARSRRSRWQGLLLALFLVGLGIRLASVLVRPHLAAGGDPLEYVGQANLLAQGKGWIEPLTYAHTGAHVQTAKLPPLFTLLMAVCSVAGFKSFFAHRVWSAILGSTAVPVAGLLGREVSGRRVGLLAALLVAVYPNMWMSDGLAMSETVSPIFAMLVIWAAYRFWKDPGPRRAATLGAVIGLAALARDELLLLAVLVLVPVALLARDRSPRERIRMLTAGAGAAVLVLAPWVGFNLSRFSHPVFISDRFGVTVAASNCDSVWHGPLRGFWSMQCAAQAAAGVRGDESAVDPVALRRGLHYVGDHIGGVPSIEVARLGRTFGFYRPTQQIEVDSFVEGRPHTWALVGLGTFYALAVGAVAGAVLLRRRRVPIYPMVAVAADVVVAVLLTYGQTRFRATLEPFLVILASVAVVAAIWRAPSSTPEPSAPR